jgi:hypothetical protein
LLIAKESEKVALAARELALNAKNVAIKSKEAALQAQIETLKSKEALLEEKSRMEEIFAREVKDKPSLKRISIAGRYYEEGSSDKGYLELFEDGTLYGSAGAGDKKSILSGVGGTYKLRGNKITLIMSIFTIPKAFNGTIDGNRLIMIGDTGKETVHIRKK